MIAMDVLMTDIANLPDGEDLNALNTLKLDLGTIAMIYAAEYMPQKLKRPQG
jgi:hypothetical protein